MPGSQTTKRAFEQLPLLLTYSQVLSCGIRVRDMRGYLDAGKLSFIQVKGKGRRRYRKCDVAKILGFEV